MLVDFFFFLILICLLLPLNLKALFNATGNLYPSLSPFPYILRLWGRRQVHNPPLPFPLCIKIPYLPPPPPPISSHSFSGKKEPFPLCGPENILHRGNSPHLDLAPLLVSLVLFCALPGALFLGGVWVIDQPWAFGDL